MTNTNNTKEQTRKFFIYARKSTDSEDWQVRSIADQIAELKELVKKENLEIVDILVEKQTAKKPGRPVFAEMLKRIEVGEAEGILAWHPDRLARNSVDGGQIICLVGTGVIKELKFPTFWFENTPQGEFMLSIAFGQSKYYIDNLSENIKRGHRQKLKMVYGLKWLRLVISIIKRRNRFMLTRKRRSLSKRHLRPTPPENTP